MSEITSLNIDLLHNEAARVADNLRKNGNYLAASLIEELIRRTNSNLLEPVAYGMADTQLGRKHKMMMVRLDKGQDGCTIPLYFIPEGYTLMPNKCTPKMLEAIKKETAWCDPVGIYNKLRKAAS